MKIKDLAVDHSYRCSESNYYSNDCISTFENWSKFIGCSIGTYDFDYFLVFRWDIETKSDETPNLFQMRIHFIQQQIGRFSTCLIDEVTDNDVESILEYLKPRYEHLNELWNPLNKLK